MSNADALPITPIELIQGDGLYSPMPGKRVRVQGVVTGKSRQGIYLQDPTPRKNLQASSAVFVFAQSTPRVEGGIIGALVEVIGEVYDFIKEENDHPSTQVIAEQIDVINPDGPRIEPVWLTGKKLPEHPAALAQFLNSIEFMVAGIEAGAVFSAPSNPFGDYALLPKDMAMPRSKHGAAIIDPKNPERWLPGFRITRLDLAPQLNVGAVLRRPISGPLNYRANSYQIAYFGSVDFEAKAFDFENHARKPSAAFTSVLTLNAFNLDQKVEDADLVEDSQSDIDDDVGDGRFEMLARVIVQSAGSPEIIALQEIQDNDGAEISAETNASLTYQLLIDAVRALNGPEYQYVDLPPDAGSDGGQPGGNIRNAYLFDPARVQLIANSVERIGAIDAAFDGSRKALLAHFKILASEQTLAVINVHLASKRHQNSIFAENDPGYDPREDQRIDQALLIRERLLRLHREGLDYYVTGDFNDFEFSHTLRALLGGEHPESINLMETIPANERYDYNHRGKLHTLMHGIVHQRQAQPGNYQFDILHSNELIGVKPGTRGTRATDHAYVIAHLNVGSWKTGGKSGA